MRQPLGKKITRAFFQQLLVREKRQAGRQPDFWPPFVKTTTESAQNLDKRSERKRARA